VAALGIWPFSFFCVFGHYVYSNLLLLDDPFERLDVGLQYEFRRGYVK